MNTGITPNTDTEVQPAATPKLETNLVDYVTDRLGASGHPNPSQWQAGLHPDVFVTTEFGIHRFLVNRQLRLVLGAYDSDTTQERYCLVDGGTADDWKRLFEEKVLPCMIKKAQASH